MTKFKNFILMPGLDEAAYPGNIGFEELVHYYKADSEKEIKIIEKMIKNSDWNGFKKQIQKVLDISLKW